MSKKTYQKKGDEPTTDPPIFHPHRWKGDHGESELLRWIHVLHLQLLWYLGSLRDSLGGYLGKSWWFLGILGDDWGFLGILGNSEEFIFNSHLKIPCRCSSPTFLWKGFPWHKHILSTQVGKTKNPCRPRPNHRWHDGCQEVSWLTVVGFSRYSVKLKRCFNKMSPRDGILGNGVFWDLLVYCWFIYMCFVCFYLWMICYLLNICCSRTWTSQIM